MFSTNKQSEQIKALPSLLGSIRENDTGENIFQQGLFGSPRLLLLALTLMYMQEMKIDFNLWLNGHVVHPKSRIHDIWMLYTEILSLETFQSALFAAGV